MHKDDSSPGLDGITVKMLKSNINIIIRQLSHIFNLAISNSTISGGLTFSVITLIHKNKISLA